MRDEFPSGAGPDKIAGRLPEIPFGGKFRIAWSGTGIDCDDRFSAVSVGQTDDVDRTFSQQQLLRFTGQDERCQFGNQGCDAGKFRPFLFQIVFRQFGIV